MRKSRFDYFPSYDIDQENSIFISVQFCIVYCSISLFVLFPFATVARDIVVMKYYIHSWFFSDNVFIPLLWHLIFILTSATAEKSDSKIGVIVGVTVSMVTVVIILIVMVLYCKRGKNKVTAVSKCPQ
jgi:hypothetical protein